MSKTLKFYSDKELQTLESEIKAGVSSTKIAQKYAENWGRTIKSIEHKACKMMKTIKVSETSKKKGRPVGSKTKRPANVITQQSDRGVTLRNGFVFDFKPQRAEMHQDHVRLYF